ncbi:synaptopodin 2-like protein isoform A [Patagioenas fasciata monilis]|uniref:Synaptopodin 2-like protein n=3 Tax=Patagioenas fasciata TaxID=372321 RepID=A0A1V4KJA1_PATFA|nr:synaptopodin 2-like protein isoform A [Patagioenas fasciata monilis]
MGAEEEMLITLSGGAPWGFRLQGGSEQKRPLQVSKIRKRSKACRGGLWENDVLVSINGKSCAGLSHASAMQIIDSSNGMLNIRVKRIVGGDQTGPRLQRSPSPGQRVLSPPSLHSPPAQLLSPEPAAAPATTQPSQPRRSQRHLESLTSPPDSEAYYGETDSDADNVAQEKHRRARRKSPRSPPDSTTSKADVPQDEVSLSEQSGYESLPEAAAQGEPEVANSGGVAKREISCPPGSRTDTPFSESEGQLRPPSTERREPSPEAMLLPHATKAIRAERHLIPMVGPVEHPVDEDLTTTYVEKAKQAKLHRHESIQEKNVKEAKTKCRTIASLLTDAPNPHSKGVLMFKKRRQRAKKYTLVSFGSVDEDRSYEEEDGVFPTSESEFDEEGFSDARSLTNHSDWDNTYLDIEKSKSDSEHKEEKQQGLSEASGILQEARRRGNKKPMFSKIEEKKNSPNPELLSLVQNLDEKPKGDHPGAGFESGPEEDFLSLGAEACNFMQSSGRKFKTPPPVAPKPQQQDAGLVNGAHDMPQLKGKGAELFAKRQSRMDKYVVETTPKPESKPRTPSPSPSLPSSWKYSPNIRAPPPIAYNPMHSPFYPLAASKSQASKAESKVKKAPGQKSGIKVIDIMRHQPYQLKSAMFCFEDPSGPSTQGSPGQPAPQASSSFTAAKQVPVKTAKTQEIRRFSTPAPMPASSSLAPTVLAPRSATTLDEPVWRTEMASSAPSTPAPFQVELSQSPKTYQSSPESEQSRELFVGMPLAGTPAPVKRKKSTKLIGKLTHEAMPQESKLNLGKKISIPRDVMLEELSLLTNKGSKMFKLRQLRVEKFIYENNPDAFTDNSVDHFQKYIPPGGHYGEDAHGYAHGRMVGGVTAGQHGSTKQQHPAGPPRPGSKGGPGDSEGEHAGESAGSGGEGGDGTDKDGKSGGKKVTIFKTYISPWERAMGISPEDKSQFTIDLLSYSPKADFPHYKSFNRTAMPYGGYEKAAKRMTFKVPQFDICPLLPESLMIYNQNFSNRPSFNRTPIPWMPSGDSSEYHTEINVPRSGETEEL